MSANDPTPSAPAPATPELSEAERSTSALIVRYEEGVLESIFGEEYLAYKARTPRWLPVPPRASEKGEYHWDEAWRSEVSTFLQYAVITAAFVGKQRMGWGV